MVRAAVARSSASRPNRSKAASATSRAEQLPADDFLALVPTFYGTRTLRFDADFAKTVLQLNTGNRRVNQRKLKQLARQMSSGEFENTGEPIIISAEGVLNDGQHRLMAVIEAGSDVEMDVRFGIPRSAFTKTDTGVARSGGDVLTIQGVTHGTQVSSAVRLLILYERGLPDSIREFVSNDAINKAYVRWPGLADVVGRMNACSLPKAVRSTPLLATAFLASLSPGADKLDRWLHVLATGLDAKRDDPAYQLRERLVRGVDAPIGTREGQLERFALMIKSWNFMQSGQHLPLKHFRWRSGAGNRNISRCWKARRSKRATDQGSHTCALCLPRLASMRGTLAGHAPSSTRCVVSVVATTSVG